MSKPVRIDGGETSLSGLCILIWRCLFLKLLPNNHTESVASGFALLTLVKQSLTYTRQLQVVAPIICVSIGYPEMRTLLTTGVLYRFSAGVFLSGSMATIMQHASSGYLSLSIVANRSLHLHSRFYALCVRGLPTQGPVRSVN